MEGLLAPKSAVLILKQSNTGSTTRRSSVNTQSFAVSSPSAGECIRSVFDRPGYRRRHETSRSKQAGEKSEASLSESRATSVSNNRTGSPVAGSLIRGCQTHLHRNDTTVIRRAGNIDAELGKQYSADGIGESHVPVPSNRCQSTYLRQVVLLVSHRPTIITFASWRAPALCSSREPFIVRQTLSSGTTSWSGRQHWNAGLTPMPREESQPSADRTATDHADIPVKSREVRV